jgi:CheY-like chemotaxis protein
MGESPQVVAILNTSDDTIELLRTYLENEGLLVVSAHVTDLRRGEQSLVESIAEHHPSVIIFDVAPPYDRNWRFLEHCRHHESLQGARWVLTSTNPERLFEIAAAAQREVIHEIIGKPYDLNEIVQAVKKALGDRNQA